MRLALASSRPSCPSSTLARRITQRSQRIPLIWIVSVTTAMALRYRSRDEIRADGRQAIVTSDLELSIGLARRRVETVKGDGQFERKRSDREGFVAVGMNELPVRSEARMWTHVPPETCVIVRQPGGGHPFDETLPLRIVTERRRCAVPWQEAEHLGADREHPGVAALEVRRVCRKGEHDGKPGQDRLHDAETGLGVGHADVDVQAADPLTSRGRAGVLDEIAVALDGRDLLLRRDARRIRARSGDDVSVLYGDLARRTA